MLDRTHVFELKILYNNKNNNNLYLRLGDGQKAAGHFGKAIKGRFVRWILENKVKKVRDFANFTEDGYRFDGENFVQAARPASKA